MKKAILFVDDEILILYHLKEQASKNFGDMFRYETAINAREAWEIIRELDREGVELVAIVSDWLMPDMHGDVFLRSVDSMYPNTRKVVITGHASPKDIEILSSEIHLHGYLEKPWKEEDLIRLLETAGASP